MKSNNLLFSSNAGAHLVANCLDYLFHYCSSNLNSEELNLLEDCEFVVEIIKDYKNSNNYFAKSKLIKKMLKGLNYFAFSNSKCNAYFSIEIMKLALSASSSESNVSVEKNTKEKKTTQARSNDLINAKTDALAKINTKSFASNEHDKIIELIMAKKKNFECLTRCTHNDSNDAELDEALDSFSLLLMLEKSNVANT